MRGPYVGVTLSFNTTWSACICAIFIVRRMLNLCNFRRFRITKMLHNLTSCKTSYFTWIPHGLAWSGTHWVKKRDSQRKNQKKIAKWRRKVQPVGKLNHHREERDDRIRDNVSGLQSRQRNKGESKWRLKISCTQSHDSKHHEEQ